MAEDIINAKIVFDTSAVSGALGKVSSGGGPLDSEISDFTLSNLIPII